MKNDRIIELLYEALKHEYVVYVDDVLKSVGFLLVALGWLLTSETATKALDSIFWNRRAGEKTGIWHALKAAPERPGV